MPSRAVSIEATPQLTTLKVKQPFNGPVTSMCLLQWFIHLFCKCDSDSFASVTLIPIRFVTCYKLLIDANAKTEFNLGLTDILR